MWIYVTVNCCPEGKCGITFSGGVGVRVGGMGVGVSVGGNEVGVGGMLVCVGVSPVGTAVGEGEDVGVAAPADAQAVKAIRIKLKING